MDDHKERMDDTRQSQNDVEEGAEIKKKMRHRKKLLIDRIRLQMEFYFSAANLSKDQFMNKLLKQSPYIDLEVFLKFNRLRALTEDMKLIRKAISKSQTLGLSEDGMKVKRLKEVTRKENEVACTIYVENIPSHADHEWVHGVFAQYGTIDYISLPHFKSTGRPKGFAFIEFQTPEMANMALEAFGSIGCKIAQDLEPSELQSVKSYQTDNEQLLHTSASEEYDRSDTQSLERNTAESQTGSKNMEDDESVSKKKRKRDDEGNIKSKKVKEEDSESEGGADIEKKSSGKKRESVEKSKTEITDKSEEVEEKAKPEKDSKKAKNKTVSDLEKAIKKVRREVESETEASGDVADKSTKSAKRKSIDKNENGDVKKSKKQKVDSTDTVSATGAGKEESEAGEEEMPCSKRKNKKKKRKRNTKEKMVAIEGASLKVMSKREWVRLRNQYLNAQRQNMRFLKDLHKRRSNESIENEVYQAVKPKHGKPIFTPNAVIKISFEEPPQDPKKLQETIREGGFGGVAYVETSPAEKDVFVRFFSAEAASAYLKAGLWSRMVLLSGNEESEYWERCTNAWERSRNKGPKHTKENRGKEKLLQRALKEACMRKPSTHVVFNE